MTVSITVQVVENSTMVALNGITDIGRALQIPGDVGDIDIKSDAAGTTITTSWGYEDAEALLAILAAYGVPVLPDEPEDTPWRPGEPGVGP